MLFVYCKLFFNILEEFTSLHYLVQICYQIIAIFKINTLRVKINIFIITITNVTANKEGKLSNTVEGPSVKVCIS